MVTFWEDNGKWWCTNLIRFTVISNIRVKLCCERIWILCSWMSLWISGLYCYLFSGQLWSRLLSRSSTKNGGGATKDFESKHKGVLASFSSRYLSIRRFGKFVGKAVDGGWPVTEGVNGSDRVSGMNEAVSKKISIGSFTGSDLSLEKFWVIQSGSLCDEVGG